jgi:hypothetical protein
MLKIGRRAKIYSPPHFEGEYMFSNKKKHPEQHYCCERCQNYWTCETKWYKGEHGEESVCCWLCSFYPCWKDASCSKSHKK